MSADNLKNFIKEFSACLQKDTFVKATFGNYRGNDPHLQKLLVRRVTTKKGQRIFILYRYDTRDTAKNYSVSEGMSLLESKLGSDFYSGHLFTTDADYQLDVGKKGKSRLNRSKPTFHAVPATSHDREKKRFVAPEGFYLKALGITNDSGSVQPRQQQKWKQINKFVEILDGLIDDSHLPANRKLKLVDMGCGKGYLTFAAYDYLKNNRNLNISVKGIDSNTRLIELCSQIADSAEFSGLFFETGTIEHAEIGETDILIALHACDTATDEAIFKGIRANASIIVASPCCHKEIRRQMTPPHLFKDVLKHGTLLERQAEIITDGMRALLLEENGYETKVFEFVPTEHTPKNNMIAAVISARQNRPEIFRRQIDDLKSEFGISNQRLESLLATR